MTWTRANPLKVGDIVTERTKILSAVAKTARASGEMIVVGLEKTFENNNGVALIDRRCVSYLSNGVMMAWLARYKHSSNI
jgi:hypothetical protein